MSHSLGEDNRWPEFGPRVAGLGVHSALSLPLIAPNRVVGAMNIYAPARGAFNDRAAELGKLFAMPAAVAVQDQQILAQAQMLAVQLQLALADRAVIDRAIGLLIWRSRLSDVEAESRLRALSRDQHLTLRQAAEMTLLEAGPGGRGAATTPTNDAP